MTQKECARNISTKKKKNIPLNQGMHPGISSHIDGTCREIMRNSAGNYAEIEYHQKRYIYAKNTTFYMIKIMVTPSECINYKKGTFDGFIITI